MKYLISLFLMFVITNAYDIKIGNETFSKEQINNFKIAYSYGKRIGYPKEVMGILYAESRGKKVRIGDKVLKPFKRSYGVMQVKLGTYYYTKKSGYITGLDDLHKMTEEEVLVELIKNSNFNIYTGVGFFKLMIDRCKSVDKAISAYNRGHCKPDNKGSMYRTKVKKFIKFIETYNFDSYIKELIRLEEINNKNLELKELESLNK